MVSRPAKTHPDAKLLHGCHKPETLEQDLCCCDSDLLPAKVLDPVENMQVGVHDNLLLQKNSRLVY